MLRRMLLTATIAWFAYAPAYSADQDPIDPNAPGWELKKEQDGIQVYTRKIDGSGIKAFQGRGILNAGVTNIVAAMSDAEACVDWVHQCTEAKNLDEVSPLGFHQYGVNDFPWPAEDRDYVLRISTHYDKYSGLFTIRSEAVEGKHPPTENHRIETMRIQYVLQPIDADHTRVYWTQHTEPGGLLPEWMINMLLVNIPFNSLADLEKIAKLEKYQNAAFEYNKEGEIIGWVEANSK